MRSQNMIDGIVRRSVERLHPWSDVIKPNKNEPQITPAGPIEPIHDICSFVNGPDESGVWKFANFGSAGET